MKKQQKKNSRKSKTKAIPRNEFRWKNKTGRTPHPHYVFAQVGNYYYSIGTTTKPKSRGKTNIQMHRNPEPSNKELSYFRPVVEVAHKNDYSNILPGWTLCKEDDEKMKPYRVQKKKS